MLQFYSASTRMVNTKRGVIECMESALGSDYSDCSLLVLHASIGHNFQELVDQASAMSAMSFNDSLTPSQPTMPQQLAARTCAPGAMAEA